jgi:hypothetical protein
MEFLHVAHVSAEGDLILDQFLFQMALSCLNVYCFGITVELCYNVSKGSEYFASL